MNFTYYGDLLGVSNYYRQNPEMAYNRLNVFYSTTFNYLRPFCRKNCDVHVNMFSDSILIWGNNAAEIIKQLQGLYIKLISKQLFFRGAIVSGTLEWDPRIVLDNFSKLLPINDKLARAVGLEKTQKGARLLIEKSLAVQLLEPVDIWLTPDGYQQNINPNISIDDMRRRICLTPDHETYEYLYFWRTHNPIGNDGYKLNQVIKKLTAISEDFKDDIAVHYTETSNLYKRCQSRKEDTANKMGVSPANRILQIGN